MVVDRPFFKGAIHVGAMYQDTAQTVELLLDTPQLGPIEVHVEQFEPNKWNFLTGMLWGIDERLHLMLEFGMGGRSYVISGLTARF